ncbi:site-specific integrase [Kribbella sp. NPDC056861]|uniref:tyrosine-type recombinase/integrase n=1 Tax=Kribbella sp. NPDC056861 TaxID=3154857 RepID=UPI0034337EC9
MTWDDFEGLRKLSRAVAERGHMVYDNDPIVLDRSIVYPERSRPLPEPETGPTFYQMYERFIAEHPYHKDSTVRAYGFHIKQLKHWWDRPVEEIEERDARELWNYLRSQGDPRAGMVLAKAVMNFARKVAKVIPENPCDVVVIPKRRKSQSIARYITEDEFEILRACAVTVIHRGRHIMGVEPDEDMRLEMDLVWETGLRSGEVSALEPKHVKIKGQQAWIEVRQTATRVGSGWGVGSPKTEQGVRDIPCSVELARRLKAHHEAHGKRFIFPAKFGGLKRPDTRCKVWTRLVARANEHGFDGECRFHDLRHAYASNLLTGNVPIGDVSVMMGHSSIQVTWDTYGHICRGFRDRILAATSRKRNRKAPLTREDMVLAS